MRQIAQRITGRYHLEPLRKDDTRAYVSHRLRVAGAQSDIFTKRAIDSLYKHSRGIPRLINVIADRALLAAYTQDRRSVDAKLVSAAAAEVFGIRRRTPWWPIATATAGVAAVVFGITNLGEAPRAPAAAPRVVSRRAGAAPEQPTWPSIPSTATPLPQRPRRPPSATAARAAARDRRRSRRCSPIRTSR